MIAFVTGATSGIGLATSLMLANHSYDLIITGRRLDRLEILKNQIETNFTGKVKILNFDVRNQEETQAHIQGLPAEWKQIDVLINNAGLAAGLDFIHEGSIENWDKMIDTNVKGLLYVSREIMPLMIERRRGHIVNVSSIAGKETYQKGNVYCASKHAVESITKAMRMELLPYSVKVSSVSPGAVETEFSEVRLGDKEAAKNVYKGFSPLTPTDIAETIEFIITRQSHININDILIMPTAQANSYTWYKNEKSE